MSVHIKRVCPYVIVIIESDDMDEWFSIFFLARESFIQWKSYLEVQCIKQIIKGVLYLKEERVTIRNKFI